MASTFGDTEADREEKEAAQRIHERKTLWECPKCHEHFYQYVIDGFSPVCAWKAKDCPAKQAAQNAAPSPS